LQCRITFGSGIAVEVSELNLASKDKPFSLYFDSQARKLGDVVITSREPEEAEGFDEKIESKFAKKNIDESLRIRARTTPTGEVQLFTLDANSFLRATAPVGTSGIFALTGYDLFDKLEDHGFSPMEFNRKTNSSIVSLLRYHPAAVSSGAWADVEAGGLNNPSWINSILKAISHESLHLFSIKHCAYYDCLMNGFTDLPEFDARAWQLCPVCLHKVSISIPGFDAKKHHESQRQMLEQLSLQFPADDIWSSKLLWLSNYILSVEKNA
jgi:predicted Zn-dependent protease